MPKTNSDNYIKFNDKAMFQLITAQKIKRRENLIKYGLLPENDSPGYILVRKEDPAAPQTLSQCDLRTAQKLAAILGARLCSVAVKE